MRVFRIFVFLIRLKVLCRILAVGNLKKTSVGRSLGKASAESFEIANYLICDAPSPTGRDEEEEEDEDEEEDIFLVA